MIIMAPTISHFKDMRNLQYDIRICQRYHAKSDNVNLVLVFLHQSLVSSMYVQQKLDRGCFVVPYFCCELDGVFLKVRWKKIRKY